MTITALPAAPSRSDDPATFVAKADAFVAALAVLVTEMNAAISVVNMTKWVSGTTYAVGDVTWSPADFQAYRRKTAGAGTTDPSADSTNWQRTEFSATSAQSQSATAYTTGGSSTAFTLTPSPALAALATGQEFDVTFHTAAGATPTLAISGLTAKSLKYRDNTGAKQAITATQVPASWRSKVVYDGTDYVVREVPPAMTVPPRRQTVLSGPVDSSGAAAFGGSTGSATLTASGTLKVTAAAGGDADYTGSITNPAWTSPAGNGTGYLMLGVSSAGVVTASVRSLAPAYQWGGTYSTTNGQLTFNIQEMTAKAGNGSTAAQVYEVCVGECAHTSGAWSGSVTWYALMGRAEITSTALQGATQHSANHNLGVQPHQWGAVVRFTASQLGYAIGDEIAVTDVSDSAFQQVVAQTCNKKSMSYQGSASTPYTVLKNSNTNGAITTANTVVVFRANRGW